MPRLVVRSSISVLTLSLLLVLWQILLSLLQMLTCNKLTQPLTLKEENGENCHLMYFLVFCHNLIFYLPKHRVKYNVCLHCK